MLGLDPGHDNCVLEQDALTIIASLHPGVYMGIPARVDVGTVYEQAFEVLRLPVFYTHQEASGS